MFTLFNENAFLVSYVLVSAAWALIAGVMFLSPTFSGMTAFSGLVAGIAGIVAVVLEHIPGPDVLITIAIAWYFAAIVFLFLWVVLTGRRLYEIGTESPVAHEEAMTEEGVKVHDR
jgi:hypothetical protein